MKLREERRTERRPPAFKFLRGCHAEETYFVISPRVEAGNGWSRCGVGYLELMSAASLGTFEQSMNVTCRLILKGTPPRCTKYIVP